jgi:single-strand DNA-binding protein
VTKGSPLLVEGRLTFQTWDGKDGQKRSKLFVTVDTFQFIDSGKGGPGGGQGGGANRPAPSQDAKPQPAAAGGGESQAPPGNEYDFNQNVEDDTIPF